MPLITPSTFQEVDKSKQECYRWNRWAALDVVNTRYF